MNPDFAPYVRQEEKQVEGRRVRVLVAPPRASFASFSAAANGGDCRLRYPILFVHGLGCSSEVWLPTIREMARRGLGGCLTLAADAPGCGRSEDPPHLLGISELADWCANLLVTLGLERAHVVGNSMGCQVGLALAYRHPERVAGLVLQGPTTGTRRVPYWRYVLGLLRDARRETLRYNLHLMKMYAQMGPIRYLKTAQKMLDDDPWPHLDGVHAPVLVIRGGRDAIVSDKVARRLTAALPDAVYLPLDSAAHAIEFNNPREFTDAMFRFLERAEAKLSGGVSETAAAAEIEPGAALSRR